MQPCPSLGCCTLRLPFTCSLSPSLSCGGASGSQGDRVKFADLWRGGVFVSQMELVCFHIEATFLCRELLICP